MSDLEKNLRQLAAKTFEDLCFAMFEDDTAESTETLPNEGAAWVGFAGPTKGCVSVRVRGEVLAELVGNMLGVEASEQDCGDAMCELANIICGNFLDELGGARDEFHMGTPSSFDSDAPPDAGDETAKSTLSLDGGVVEVAVYLDEAA